MAEARKEPVEEAVAEPQVNAEDVASGSVTDLLEHEIVQLKVERDELKDRFMRALADAENARKRADRERREAEQYGGSKLARDMLPVFDSMKRALDAISEEQRETYAALIEGVELTQRELVNVFKKHGITSISPEPGDTFDPQLHQAMFEAPVPGTKAGEIIQVMADGFMLHDRLLRPGTGRRILDAEGLNGRRDVVDARRFARHPPPKRREEANVHLREP